MSYLFFLVPMFYIFYYQNVPDTTILVVQMTLFGDYSSITILIRILTPVNIDLGEWLFRKRFLRQDLMQILLKITENE